jgi:hypothetical protein
MVEGAIIEAKIGGIPDLESDAGIQTLPHRMSDVFRGDIDPDNGTDMRAIRERKGQAASPAADIQDPGGLGHARKVDQQRSQPPAPTAHLQIVPGPVGGQERRRGGHQSGSGDPSSVDLHGWREALIAA